MVIELNAILEGHRINFDLLQEMAKEYKILISDNTKKKIPTKKYRKLIETACIDEKGRKNKHKKKTDQCDENSETIETTKLLSSSE